jgi:hypothetical protein
LIGVELDYELSANAALDTSTVDPHESWQDSVMVTVYVDGRSTAYDVYYFCAEDSALAAADPDCRRVQYVSADSLSLTISDPTYANPCLYQFQIDWGGALAATSNPGKINALRAYYTARNRRQ